MNGKYHAMALQCYLSSMALYLRRLPPDYQIVLRFTQGDYATALLDPDGTQISNDTQQFAELCEIAQKDAKRRASDHDAMAIHT